MENAKRKIEDKKRKLNYEEFPASGFQSVVCAACGARARRETASFCLVCGKLLEEDYEPLDAFRASYRLQGKSFPAEKVEEQEITNLFEQYDNPISQTAWACLVYSFVPYLGILFVPITIAIGGFGYFSALRQPDSGGRKLALISISLSFVVLAIQIFLWWLLYIIPELGRNI